MKSAVRVALLCILSGCQWDQAPSNNQIEGIIEIALDQRQRDSYAKLGRPKVVKFSCFRESGRRFDCEALVEIAVRHPDAPDRQSRYLSFEAILKKRDTSREEVLDRSKLRWGHWEVSQGRFLPAGDDHIPTFRSVAFGIGNPVATRSDEKSAWDRCTGEPDRELAAMACGEIIHLGRTVDEMVEGLMWRAQAFLDTGRKERAFLDMTTIIRLNPLNTPALKNRGILHRELGHYNAALLDFSEILRIEPSAVSAYVQRAYTYSQIGDDGLALRDYLTALRLDPTDRAALHNVCALAGGRGVHGLSYCDEAIRLHSPRADLYTTRGLYFVVPDWHDRRKEYLEAAKSHFDIALAIDPRSQCAWLLRADVKRRLGDPEGAYLDMMFANGTRRSWTECIGGEEP